LANKLTLLLLSKAELLEFNELDRAVFETEEMLRKCEASGSLLLLLLNAIAASLADTLAVACGT
jgi:hypothetical protein